MPVRQLCRGAVWLLLVVLATSGLSRAQDEKPTSTEALLVRYQNGELDADAQLAGTVINPEHVQSSIVAAADAWIARDPSDILNRRLIATAFAIELAYARLAYDDATLLALLDWSRKEWLKGAPSNVEYVWTRAAVALVGRGGGGFSVAPGPGQRARIAQGSAFLESAAKRFPDDARFRFAVLASPMGLPYELFLRPERASSIERLLSAPDVDPYLLLELAFMKISEPNPEEARRIAQQAASRSDEAWIRYLSHFIAAVAHEFEHHYQDAAREYAAALDVVPYAQSASIALAQLLLRDNQAEPALNLLDRSLTERPDGDDPWRVFAYGEFIRWPMLIADVRKAIH
jgi:tetratricopeptide (TPR) repeat protein